MNAAGGSTRPRSRFSFAAARQHVEGRAEDLAQVRPEWGHATNAICIVGRREWTRGLFLDRRAFLTSYDPDQDDAEGTILTRILQAVFPVCAGISLEYYFSYVDNIGWGCGTKLPHNIASLVGVMDGAVSDLRTGLPWQMVEIHEPVRILFVVETTPETMLEIMDRNPGIGRLCRNRWVQLAVIDFRTNRLSVFDGREFRPYEPQAAVLPQAASSVDWYRGWRDHLEFAEIAALEVLVSARQRDRQNDRLRAVARVVLGIVVVVGPLLLTVVLGVSSLLAGRWMSNDRPGSCRRRSSPGSWRRSPSWRRC